MGIRVLVATSLTPVPQLKPYAKVEASTLVVGHAIVFSLATTKSFDPGLGRQGSWRSV